LDRPPVCGVIFGVYEQNTVRASHCSGDCDRELLLDVLGVDGEDLDLFVGMVVTSGVSLLELNGDSRVVVTRVFHKETLDLVELALFHGNPFGLVLG
jgi:hypothetical protein